MKSDFPIQLSTPRPSAEHGIPVRVACVVFVVAVMTNVASLLGSQLWVYPDSIDYVQLAGGIADRFDLTNELFLVRTPGYPVFLAIVFWVFGDLSPGAILVVQHAMAVATAVFTAAITWRLTSRRSAAIIAGVFCACSLQILAYANMVLTETPYTLTLIASVYCLVRYHQAGQRRWLIFASLLAGVGYLLRPVALYLLAVCSAAGLFHVWKTRERRLPRLAVELAWAIAPAMTVAAPWMAISAASHHSLQAARCLDYMFYLRSVTFDKLDSTQSAAMRDIHAVIDEAKRDGHLGPNADFRDRATVIKAYQGVRNMPFAESSKVLGQAGRDIMLEHPSSIALGTFKYAAWMLLSPDPVYRFLPGGMAGNDGKRDTQAVIYDSGTYAFGEGSWEWLLKDYRQYLPLSARPRALTPGWTAAAEWFHRHMEIGRPFVGLGDSPFEECILLCTVGGVLSLFQRRRAEWFLVGLVLSLHVLVSAFFSGPQTRYAVPVKPILWLYLALLLVTAAQWLVSIAGNAYRGVVDRMRRAEIHVSRPVRNIRSVIWIVLLAAMVVDGLALSASRLWVVPTSLEYLELAVDVAERFDFSNELFLLRTPGYPILLAVVFRLFGAASPMAILLLQHAMTVATAALTGLTAWHLTRRRDVTLLAGVFCACSLQTIAFANQIMTETPYTLALIASVYFAVKFHQYGALRCLAFASLTASIAYLIRPIGLTMICLLPLVALHRVWCDHRRCRIALAAEGPWPGKNAALGPSLARALSCALIPAAACTVPWWVQNHVVHGTNSFARCYDFALYNRAANVERHDNAGSEALAEVHRVVDEAKSTGRLAPDADEGMAWTVWQAFRGVEDEPLKRSSALLGRAASQALWEDPVRVVEGTIKYSAWMMLTPDSGYRYHPGGAKGVHGRRPQNADVFDSGLYLEPFEAPLREYSSYLPLEGGPKRATPIWIAIARWFYREVEKGPAILGVGDSLYEELMLVSLLGMVVALCTRQRSGWIVVGAVVILQIVPSAFVAGVGPRYAVPIQPLVKLFGALMLATMVQFLWNAVRVAYTSAVDRGTGRLRIHNVSAPGSA